MTDDSLLIEGSCHCGRIRFTLAWPQPADVIPVRACGCDFCQKHAGVWTAEPRSSLTVYVDDVGSVSRYRFGTETAEFLVCARCGVTPVATSEIDGGTYAVVNSRTFAPSDAFELSRSDVDFDGEDVGGRLERRKRNWIPQVRIVEAGDRRSGDRTA